MVPQTQSQNVMLVPTINPLVVFVINELLLDSVLTTTPVLPTYNCSPL